MVRLSTDTYLGVVYRRGTNNLPHHASGINVTVSVIRFNKTQFRSLYSGYVQLRKASFSVPCPRSVIYVERTNLFGRFIAGFLFVQRVIAYYESKEPLQTGT